MYDFKGFNDIIVLGSRMDSWVLYTYFNTLISLFKTNA